jgi:hypothetical protein
MRTACVAANRRHIARSAGVANKLSEIMDIVVAATDHSAAKLRVVSLDRADSEVSP